MVYCVQTFVASLLNPIQIRIAFGSICIITVVISMVATMAAKIKYLVHVISAKIQEGHAKPYLDDIAHHSGERERLETGSKEDKIAICQRHLIVWQTMLAAVSNSEFRSSSKDGSNNRSADHADGGRRSQPMNNAPSHAPSQYHAVSQH